MTDEIALFIDFENIRYSLINVQRREPDPQELIALARRFGTVMVARAYADWTRQPEFFKGSLTAAMIDRVDCPAKVRDRFRNGFGQNYQQQAQYAPLPGPDASGQDFARPEDDGEDEDDEAEYETSDEPVDQEEEAAGDGADESAEESFQDVPPHEDRRRYEPPSYQNGGGYYPGPQPVITQSTVDLNMLMDIIECVFDRPSINTYILMSGDRDFTRICARLKLRLNKRVIVIGVPGTVSRDLIAAAEQFIPLGMGYGSSGNLVPPPGYHSGGLSNQFSPNLGPVEPDEPGFIQFLDYIDRHWSWRTVGGVANFIGDPFNPKNRFRGRLTRDSARDLLRLCIDESILVLTTDPNGSENLRLNRSHPSVETVLNEVTLR